MDTSCIPLGVTAAQTCARPHATGRMRPSAVLRAGILGCEKQPAARVGRSTFQTSVAKAVKKVAARQLIMPTLASCDGAVRIRRRYNKRVTRCPPCLPSSSFFASPPSWWQASSSNTSLTARPTAATGNCGNAILDGRTRLAARTERTLVRNARPVRRRGTPPAHLTPRCRSRAGAGRPSAPGQALSAMNGRSAPVSNP